jgi:16S rRNA processing protein RimM
MAEKDVVIGKIIGTYGNRGMVKIFPLTDFPERFLKMSKMTLENDGNIREYTVSQAKKHQKYIVVKYDQVTDMTMAETLKGSLIKISKDELMPLPEGSFYIFDIIGLEVYSVDGEFIGVVEDVLQTGANDVYVINNKEKKEQKPLLIPALKEVVKEIDIKGGKMVISPLQEY